jgi:catechol 2,3-dioxygenase-like lactoylglutathione lyase family enzyme
MNATPPDDKSTGAPGWADVVGIGAAATAILTTIGGLAVTGALQRMQRDHGLLLIAALGFAIAGATAWLSLAILKPTLGTRHYWPKIEVVGHLAAVVLFVGGTLVGIYGMIRTQGDQPRPMVSATLDANTLALDVTTSVHNLGINHRLVTLIVGLKDKPGGYDLRNRYLAISGPDQDGNVTQHIALTLPRGLFSRVGVTATRSATPHVSRRQLQRALLASEQLASYARGDTMIKLSNAQLWVHDQDEALAFYTGKLGWEVRSDVTVPELDNFRWLAVGPADQPDIAITLMAIPGPPILDAATAVQLRDLLAKGFAGTLFLTTDDVQASYEELKSRGIEFFDEPEERIYGIDSGFRDPSGNNFRLTQLRELPAA